MAAYQNTDPAEVDLALYRTLRRCSHKYGRTSPTPSCVDCTHLLVGEFPNRGCAKDYARHIYMSSPEVERECSGEVLAEKCGDFELAYELTDLKVGELPNGNA